MSARPCLVRHFCLVLFAMALRRRICYDWHRIRRSFPAMLRRGSAPYRPRAVRPQSLRHAEVVVRDRLAAFAGQASLCFALAAGGLACGGACQAQELGVYFPSGAAGYEQELGVTVQTRLHPDYEPTGIQAGAFVIHPSLDEFYVLQLQRQRHAGLRQLWAANRRRSVGHLGLGAQQPGCRSWRRQPPVLLFSGRALHGLEYWVGRRLHD